MNLHRYKVINAELIQDPEGDICKLEEVIVIMEEFAVALKERIYASIDRTILENR